MIPDIYEVIKEYPEFKGIHPACVAVPMIDEEGFKELVGSIKLLGLIDPLVRTKDGLLLDGRTRLLACHETGQEIRVEDSDGVMEPWEYVAAKNMDRRHLTVGQKAIFANAWREAEEFKARGRQGHGQTAPGKKKNASGNSTISVEPTTRDRLGARVGVSGSSIDKAKKIREFLPELTNGVRDGAVSLESAYRDARAREKQLKSVASDSPAKTNGASTMIVTPQGEKTEIPAPKKVVFNKTTDAVDWARWTWNPVTGCEHGCSFCYAREIANSDRMAAYYPNKFEPTFHEYRLAAPANTKPPESADARDRRVFVCSMADLFGKWVPAEWIEKVFDACLESPEWQYMFLTKWPARYSKMPLIPRAWYGASITHQRDVSRVETAMSKIGDGVVKWVSMEPMLSWIEFSDLSWCDLVVIGAQTSTNQPDGFHPAVSPEFDWVVDVVNQCRDAGVPYYLKANLGTEQPGMKLPKMEPRNQR